MTHETSTLLDGLAFPEGPRWHRGELWFSDMHGEQILRVGPSGESASVASLSTWPSGLGWLPEDGSEYAGRLLVVSMTDRRLLRLDPDGFSEVADLSKLASFHCNDMVVDAQGRSYVGNFGFDLNTKAEYRKAELILVTREGEARIVADDLAFPNGTVITPDGRSLIVGESFGARLTRFDIEPDGSLTGRRQFAKLDGAVPDGICLDAEGAIWLASPVSGEVLRVREGGEVTDRIPVATQAFACMLGGADRRTLFICTAASSDPEECRNKRTGRIETIEVQIPGAGLP